MTAAACFFAIICVLCFALFLLFSIGARFMATVQQQVEQLIAEVNNQETKLDSLIALTSGLKQRLDEILADATVPPAVQNKIDELFAELSQNSQKIDDAIAANTPNP